MPVMRTRGAGLPAQHRPDATPGVNACAPAHRADELRLRCDTLSLTRTESLYIQTGQGPTRTAHPHNLNAGNLRWRPADPCPPGPCRFLRRARAEMADPTRACAAAASGSSFLPLQRSASSGSRVRQQQGPASAAAAADFQPPPSRPGSASGPRSPESKGYPSMRSPTVHPSNLKTGLRSR